MLSALGPSGQSDATETGKDTHELDLMICKFGNVLSDPRSSSQLEIFQNSLQKEFFSSPLRARMLQNRKPQV